LLAVFLLPLIAQYFAFGLRWRFWRVADMDFVVVYEASKTPKD